MFVVLVRNLCTLLKTYYHTYHCVLWLHRQTTVTRQFKFEILLQYRVKENICRATSFPASSLLATWWLVLKAEKTLGTREADSRKTSGRELFGGTVIRKLTFYQGVLGTGITNGLSSLVLYFSVFGFFLEKGYFCFYIFLKNKTPRRFYH